MNWEMFCAAITWAVTIASGFIVIGGSVEGDWEGSRKFRVFLIGSAIVFMIGIATISGMGWTH